MKPRCQLLWLSGSISLFCVVASSPVCAQIARDSTLSTRVTSQGGLNFVIRNGNRAGGNLFHSFSNFSVPEGGSASFQGVNPAIKNVFSRVTGASSNINGSIEVLQTNGAVSSANFFLLNPKGIVFGPNASLNIGGSFLASTASSLKFADGGEFSATNLQIPESILTISAPIGLQFGRSTASIQVREALLQVPPGKTLGLLGGNLTLTGGEEDSVAALVALGGRIELGSVAGATTPNFAPVQVSLTPINQGWALGYEGIQNFRNIQLSKSIVDASGEGGGDVQLQGGRVTLTDGSLVGAATGAIPGGKVLLRADQLTVQGGAQVSTIAFGEGRAGDLTVTASDSVELIGIARSPDGEPLLDGLGLPIPSGLITQTEGAGAAGTLMLETGKLIVREGAEVSASTSGIGLGGTLTVTASDSVELIGIARSPDGKPLLNASGLSLSSGLFTKTEATQDAGNLSISTGKLIVREGAQVNSTTFGVGNAGALTVNASEVELVGNALTADGELLINELGLPFPSGLFADTKRGSTGNGGTLTVVADRLNLRDGGVIQTSTGGAGDAGDLKVQASEFVQLIGKPKGSLLTTSLLATSGGTPGLPGIDEATGQGGNIDIKIGTGQLLVQDGAAIAVSSINRTNAAKGAGNITVTAPTISLDDGDITAASASGNGGNIGIQVPDLLLLRRNSNISTSAGSAETGGDGGNIEIDTNSIVAVPQENSDITANAFSGSGGNVDIEVQGNIFGLESRSRQELQELLRTDNPGELDPTQLPSNDITAISQANPSLDGLITINTPDVDPSKQLANLPTEPVNTEIAQDCQTGGGKGTSRFISSGSGGLPTNPYEPLDSRDILADVQPPAQWGKTSAGAARVSSLSERTSAPIVEAQGWSVNQTGEIVLVAEVSHDPAKKGCRLR